MKLSERVEALTGPDRKVDAEIAIAINHQVYPGYGTSDFVRVNLVRETHAADLANLARHQQNVWYEGLLKYTASLDAAMTLVPEGWVIGIMSWWPCSDSATVHMDNKAKLKACSGATSLPVALTAACLRARGL
jgi:hypothetical protein